MEARAKLHLHNHIHICIYANGKEKIMNTRTKFYFHYSHTRHNEGNRAWYEYKGKYQKKARIKNQKIKENND